MATPHRQTPQAPVQAALGQLLPLEKNYRDAVKLFSRFRQAQGFRQYLQRRAAFVIPMLALFVLVSVACTAATVIFLADRHALLALPGMVLAPFVLVGSFFVEAFVFFSWLEGRALTHGVPRSRRRSDAAASAPSTSARCRRTFLGCSRRCSWSCRSSSSRRSRSRPRWY